VNEEALARWGGAVAPKLNIIVCYSVAVHTVLDKLTTETLLCTALLQKKKLKPLNPKPKDNT